jgi:hypothetical protein
MAAPVRNILETSSHTVHSECRCAFRLRYVDLVVSIEVTPLKCAVISLYSVVNLLNPTGYVMHQQFYIQQLYALPTLYLCVLY